MNTKFIQVLLAALLLTAAINIQATTVTYTATNLTDTTAGEDLWQYSYQVSDHTFTADTGFSIHFDLGLYDLLDPTPLSPNADWDVLAFDPDPSLPDDGLYDAFALVDNASLADLFTINFVWLGTGSEPNSQAFEVYDGITFSTLENGNTTAPSTVPLPPALWLFVSGVAIFISKKRVMHKNGYGNIKNI